ncbi:TetR/AcrR family transcriptional regulator [Jatrophihabitans fulvus]
MTDLLATPPPLTPAGERIAVAAGDLFFAHGVRAVGVDAIAEAAGTTKKTLYDRFGSKDALVALWLVRRALAWQQFLEAQLARRRRGPTRVLGVFDAVERWMAGSARGCAFVNTYGEVGGTDHPAVPVIRAEKDWMRRRFVELVGEAGVPRADTTGRAVHLLYEGALVTATAGGDGRAIADARNAAGRLLSR